jgi:hypothetical protein
MSSLETWFVVLILTFNSSLMQLLLTFNLSFCNLATVLDTFPKIGQFFPKLQVTLVRTYSIMTANISLTKRYIKK